MAQRPPRLSVELQPVGRRAHAPAGTTLLAAARSAGVSLTSVCGGTGVCGSCRIRLLSGLLTPPSEREHLQLTRSELAEGWRLACQAEISSDVRIEIPGESLTAAQRLQLEANETAIDVDPPVVGIDVELAAPALGDQRADARRVLDALRDDAFAGGAHEPQIPLPVLAEIPERLRAQLWSGRVVLHRPSHEILALRPQHNPLLGLAVDLGTTKLAAYLVDLASGETLAQTGAMNPQVAHGEDVMSRIAYANGDPRARRELHELVIVALSRMTAKLCDEAGTVPAAILDCVVVGNTAMHHLFAGLPVRQLGEAPYVAAASGATEARAADAGLELATGARLYMPPLIAGYVGADHVAMLLASGMHDTRLTALALDVGTNTEISLAHDGRLWSCSAASGPAFEGAHISNGMRAAPGAIERVQYRDGRFLVQTVADRPAVGLCGSGILDAVAESLRAGIITQRGALRREHPLVSSGDGGTACTLVPASTAGHHRDVVFTRADVAEIQLAKGAIRAGTELLLEAAGIEPHELDRVIVAGAFGTYLDIDSAIRVGLLPDLPRERFQQVGNAAGAGARQLLLSRRRRAEAVELGRRAQYLELTTHPAFEAHFVQSIGFR